MADKILCPWCGAEMRASVAMLDVYGAIARYECSFCHACGPQRRGLQKEETSAAARAAALRRYTPLLKPMTVEEIKQVRYEETAFWIEFAGTYKEEPSCHWHLWSGLLGYSAKVVGYCEPWFLTVADYGKTWRCWSRKPTDEERSAAEWE